MLILALFIDKSFHEKCLLRHFLPKLHSGHEHQLLLENIEPTKQQVLTTFLMPIFSIQTTLTRILHGNYCKLCTKLVSTNYSPVDEVAFYIICTFIMHSLHKCLFEPVK